MKLKILQKEEEHWFEITTPAITIGRSSENDIDLSNQTLSRKHCSIEKDECGYYITDLNSRNGTKVNGESITRRSLKVGDKIEIGDVVIFFEETSEHSPSVKHRRIKKRKPRKMYRVLTQICIFSVCFFICIFLLSKVLSWRIFDLKSGIVDHDLSRTIFDQALQLEKENKLEESLTKYEELNRLAPETAYGEKARESISRINAIILHENKAKIALTQAIQKYEVFGYSPYDYQKKLTELKSIFSNTSTYAEIQSELARVKLKIDNIAHDSYQKTKKEALLFLEQKEYRRSIDRIQNFLAEDHPSEWRKKGEDDLQNIYRHIEKEYQNVLEQGKELLKQENIYEIRDFIVVSSQQFQGTRYANEIKENLLPLVEDLSKKKEKKNSRELENLDAYISAGKYKEGLEIAQNMLSTADKSLKKKVESTIEWTKRMLVVQEQLYKEINNGLLKGEQFKIGKIKEATPLYLVLSLIDGKAETSLRWDSISNLDMLSLFEKVVLKVDTKLDDYVFLANYCYSKKMDKDGTRYLIKAINRFPNQKPEIDKFYADRAGIPVPIPDGFTIYKDELVSPSEKVKLILEERVNNLLSALNTENNKERENTLSQLKQLETQGEKVFGKTYILKLHNKIFEYLLKTRETTLNRLESHLNFQNKETLRHIKNELNIARKHALDLIFDENAYPYDETHGAKMQPEVNKRVEKVKEIWERPMNIIATFPTAMGKDIQKVRKLNEEIKVLYPHFEYESKDKVHLEYMSYIINKKLNIQNFALDSEDERMIAYNTKVMEENEKSQGVATHAEKEQVRITNLYRIMMGRQALKIDDCLVKAARKHSEYLSQTGLFGHVIKGEPCGETPSERTKREGFNGIMVGENIAKGTTDPGAAHNMWYNSSGHHRNILSEKWVFMGTGQANVVWTQNFGN